MPVLSVGLFVPGYLQYRNTTVFASSVIYMSHSVISIFEIVLNKYNKSYSKYLYPTKSCQRHDPYQSVVSYLQLSIVSCSEYCKSFLRKMLQIDLLLLTLTLLY